MPRIPGDPGSGPIVKPKRRGRVRRPRPAPVSAPAAENARQIATGKIRPPRKSKPIHVEAPEPKTDVQSSGGDYGTGKANDYKNTRQYRGDVRAAYKAASPKRKRQLLKNADRRTVEGRTILHEHESRIERNRQIKKGQAGHDVVTNADLARAERFKQTDEYKSLLDKSKPERKASDIYLTDPKALKAAGFKVDKAEAYAQIPARVIPTGVEAAKQIAIATKEDPGAVLKNTVKSVPGTVAAIPAGLVEAPIKIAKGEGGQLAKGIKDDFVRRYGDLSKGAAGEKRFRERIKKEGALPEAIDISGVAGGGIGAAGKGLGIAGRSATVARIAERGGVAGKAARAVRNPVVKPRAKLRKTAGARGAVEQELSSNYVKAVAQKATDRRRAKRFAKRAAKGEIRGLKPGAGEVVRGGVDHKLFKFVPSQARDQRIAVSRDTSRGHVKQKRIQDREIRQGIEKERRNLNPDEKKVETLALQGLIHFDDTTKTKELLTAYRDRIIESRKAREDAEGRPLKVRKKSNELDRVNDVLKMIEDNPKGFVTKNLRDYHAKQVERYHRLREGDQVTSDLTAEVRRHQPLGRVLGEHTKLDNQVAKIEEKLDNGDFGKGNEARAKADDLITRARRQFVARVKQHQVDQGLPEPVYVGHRANARTDFGSYSAGGARAMRGTKRSKFTLFDEGRADTTAGAYTDSIAQSTKRNINWNTVADTFEKHTPEWGRNKTVRELERALDDRNLNHDDWRLVNLGKFRKLREQLDDADNAADPSAHTEQALHDTVVNATHTLSGASADFANSARRLSLVPKGVADELEAMVKPSGAGIRLGQKIMGTQSKLILGTSPSFVPVQVAANAPLAALAIKNPAEWVRGNLAIAGKNPVNWIRGQKGWKHVDDATKDYINDYFGMSASGSSSSTPRFGSTIDEANSLVKGYRSLTQSKPALRAKESKVNPLTWNHRTDDLQNNWFRSQVFKADMAKEARQISESMDAAKREMDPLAKVLAMPDGPEKIVALRKAEPQIERMGEHVDELLGNYTRFTANERKLAKSTVLFYPFLRFALKFSLYTLPVKHPVAATIAAKMGELHREEVIDLLGDEILKSPDAKALKLTKDQASDIVRNNTPAYGFGRVYYGTGDKLQSIDFSRINPLATQALDLLPQQGEGAIGAAFRTGLGAISPAFMSVLKAAQGEDPVTKQPLNVGEHKTPFGGKADMTTGREAAVIAHDVLELNPLIRQYDRSKTKGKMPGDDFIPGINENVVKFGKGSNDAKRIRKRAATAGSTQEQLQDTFIPFRKRGDQMPDTAEHTYIYRKLDKIKLERQTLKDRKDRKSVKRDTQLKEEQKRLEIAIGFRKPPKPKKRGGSALGSGLDGGLGGGLDGGLG